MCSKYFALQNMLWKFVFLDGFLGVLYILAMSLTENEDN